MKVGILVDGQSEFRGLSLFIPRITTNFVILRPLYCDMQPFAPPAQIAYIATKHSRILIERGASLIVLLIDKESRPECAPEISREIESEFSNRLTSYYAHARGAVVIKNSTFENWLVADPTAIEMLSGMFENVKIIRDAVIPDKADNIDAIQLLERCCTKDHFNKVKAAMAVCDKLNPDYAAKNSRSFRRFLRVVNHPSYTTQSRNP